MSKKRKPKVKKVLLNRKGEPISPILIRARALRNSLLRRSKNEEIRATTPCVNKLFSFLSLDSYTCAYCLRNMALEEMTIDHRIPLDKGGNHYLDNLCFCCAPCNQAKGNISFDDFMALLNLISTWDDKGEYLLRRLRMGNSVFGR